MDSALVGRRLDRTAVYVGMAGVTAVAWVVTVQLTAAMQMPVEPMDLAAVMPSTARQLALTAAMWAAMMVGMMVPSATPMVLTYAEWTRRGPENGGRVVAVGSLLAGYLTVWSAFSLVAAGVHVALDRAGLVTSMGAVARPALGGTLLIAAGLFQLSPWKESCLRGCRTPFGFLAGEWRDGPRGALTMGVRHGAFCLGCCWVLMGLLFVVGAMQLAWMAAIAVFVLAEKIAPRRLRIGRVAATVLIGWGTWTLLATTI